MSEWREVELGDLGAVVTGTTPPAERPEWFGDSLPFITPSDIAPPDRRARPDRSLSEDGRIALQRRLLPPGSVCFVCIGATIGKLCLTDIESVTNQQINSVVSNDSNDGRFLYYLLRHEAPRIASTAGGAATPLINKTSFSHITVRVPDKRTQQAISAVLSRLDDLIEHNRRRFEILEKMARAIYREWFVHFRHPGHERDSLVDSEVGPIPNGWSLGTLGDVAELDRTGIQPSKFADERFDHYSIPAFDEGALPAIAEGSSIKSGKYVLSTPAVLVSKLNPRIERTWFVEPAQERRAVTSTEFLILRPRPRSTLEHLYLASCSEPFQGRLRELSGGTSTSHQRAKPTDFIRLRVVCPPLELVERLTEITRPMLALARTLRSQSRDVLLLRDHLLPKLVTGAIDVSSLDFDPLVESSVA